MSSEQDKRELLKQAAARAIEKQPDEIHLSPAPQHAWSNAAAIDAHVATLLSLGFSEAGTYTIDSLGISLRFFLKSADRMYSTVYEHPKAGIWLNFVVLYRDGSSMTFTTMPDRGLEQRPGHPIVHAHLAAADKLYPIAVSRAPDEDRKTLSAEAIPAEFERAWAEGVRWRKNRGVSM